jgi:RNA-directed DNA polymerase
VTLPIPEGIRTLQGTLYAKAEQERGVRFYALHDKLARADILSHASGLACANEGAPGIDGRSLEAI